MWSKIRTMLANAIAGELVKTWLLPFASTLGAGLVGWLQEVPLFYMFVGLALFFAAVSTGLLRFTEWQYRNRVVDKLVFKSLRVAPNILNAASVDLVRFGFLLSNKSEFPIQFEIEKLHTSFGDYYAPKKDYKRNSITIPPHGDGWFDDHNISVGEPLVGSEKGILEYRLKYGRPGRLHHILEQKKVIYFGFNNEKNIVGIEWVDE